MGKKTLEFASERDFHKLYFENPKNIQALEKSLGCGAVARNKLHLDGDPEAVHLAETLFRLLESAQKQGYKTKNSDFCFLKMISEGKKRDSKNFWRSLWFFKFGKKL